MARNFNQIYIRTVETDLISGAVADDDYDFELDPHAARNNLLEYFHFTDGAGDPIDATGGTVVVTMASGNDVFLTLPEGSFSAVDARLATRTKPNGYGKADKIRITLAGITGPAVGFAGLVTQSVS